MAIAMDASGPDAIETAALSSAPIHVAADISAVID
jgi:hypothetical protein